MTKEINPKLVKPIKFGLSLRRTVFVWRFKHALDAFVYFHYNNKTLDSYVYMFTKPVR